MHKPNPTPKRTSTPSFAPLTKAQRAQVATLRARAFARQHRLGLVDQPIETWNAHQTHHVFARKTGPQTKRTSLLQATQNDFALLMAHFNELAGHQQEADHWYRRDETGNSQSTLPDDTPEARRRELYLLRQECETKNLPFPGYPLAIARNRHWFETGRTTLEELTPTNSSP